MASAWGNSWGKAWGNSWGSVGVAPDAGGTKPISRRKRDEDEEIEQIIRGMAPEVFAYLSEVA